MYLVWVMRENKNNIGFLENGFCPHFFLFFIGMWWYELNRFLGDLLIISFFIVRLEVNYEVRFFICLVLFGLCLEGWERCWWVGEDKWEIVILKFGGWLLCVWYIVFGESKCNVLWRLGDWYVRAETKCCFNPSTHG